MRNNIGKVALELVFSFLLIMFACLKAPQQVSKATQVAKGQGAIKLLQQNKYLLVRLYGMMNFTLGGQTRDWPAELVTSSIPLEWMGQVFNGKVEKTGPGNDITDQVHGGVSADGEWLLTLSFSRRSTITGSPPVSYSAELKNVPIAKITAGVAEAPGSFQKEGDIQKYISSFEYSVGDAIYTSIDWNNDNQGQRPSLKITFEKEASKPLSGPAISGGGM